MDSTLKARFARLGPIRAVDRVGSGSAAVFVLRLVATGETPKTIDAMHVLARRGLTMLRAKRAVEALLVDGRVYVDLPMVEDADAVTEDLARAGIAAARVDASASVNVRALRDRLRLSREQFAVRYGFEVETLRNWETGRRDQDTAARSYLRVIANDPEQAERAYAPTPSLTPTARRSA